MWGKSSNYDGDIRYDPKPVKSQHFLEAIPRSPWRNAIDCRILTLSSCGTGLGLLRTGYCGSITLFWRSTSG